MNSIAWTMIVFLGGLAITCTPGIARSSFLILFIGFTVTYAATVATGVYTDSIDNPPYRTITITCDTGKEPSTS